MPNDDYQSQCDQADLELAKEFYERFCATLYSDPAKAKTQLVAGIQVALCEARKEGYGIGRWARDIPDLPTEEADPSSQ